MALHVKKAWIKLDWCLVQHVRDFNYERDGFWPSMKLIELVNVRKCVF